MLQNKKISIKQRLASLPKEPGIYQFKNDQGKILYIGKAKTLRTRVQSYFRENADLDPSKQRMIPKIADIQTITTNTETEALVLEANLIREHQPPYNVLLRDDKYYLFIKITTNEDIPRVFPVRKIKQDGARYFGPYSSASSVRRTLKLLRRIFPFKEEKESPREKIFPHPLFSRSEKSAQRSSEGAKLGHTSPAKSLPFNQVKDGGMSTTLEKNTHQTTKNNAYQDNITNIIHFLQGHRQDIVDRLKTGMKEASKAKQYERAAIFRDQLRAIERLEGTQKVYLPRKESFDIISLARGSSRSAANIFSVRQGKLLNKNTFLLQHRSATTPTDTLRQFILQYYRVAQDIPKVILIPAELEDHDALAKWINENEPPEFFVPHRGKKKQLLTMGELNAQQVLDQEEIAFESDAKSKQAVAELFQALNITVPENHPARIETYDISNIQGTLATGSMVVFVDGKPDKSQYRKFKIRIDGKPDDFAMLQEVLDRRFSSKHKDWVVPDLLLIDGGKGQLSSVKKVLDQKGITISNSSLIRGARRIRRLKQKESVPQANSQKSTTLSLASLAKREEELFVPGNSQSIRLPYNSPALYLIQRMRDEAHRFTITYHRLLRSKKSTRSILDEVPGIGPKTKKKLLNHFGSLKAIRSASDEELGRIIGKSTTQSLRDFL